MKTKLIHFIVLSGLTLCALPAAAQISLVKTGSLNNTAGATSYTLSFDAGNGGTANKLIVSAGTESGSAAQITSITYNGQPLTIIPNTGGASTNRNRGIWYLDNPFSGGAADIIVTGTATFSHMRLGVASISGSAPGAAIGNLAGAASVSLNVPVNDSFVFAANASNEVSPATTADTLTLSPIFGVTGDSANMAAGYANPVAAGTATYSFTNTLEPQTSAAAFVPASAFPVLTGFSPADNAINAALGANLVATFSEPVVAGTGNIELWQIGGASPVETFNVASSPQLTFSGQKLTINPTSNLTPGVEYYILIASGAVVDTTGGQSFAGISDPTAWSFTTDNTPPTLVSLNPADNTLGVRTSSNLVATFSETVLAGTGNVELWQDGGGSALESFNVASSPQLTFSGATLTINPTADLTPGIGYHIRIAPTAIVDASNFAFAGFSDPTLWNFTTDGTLPTLATLSPVDGASLVSLGSNLVATFSEAVAVGTGNIELWKVGGVSPVESFDVTSSPQLTISGAALTINPTANLDYSAAYYVIIPSTAVKDLSGNLFSGLTTSTAWNFTSANLPPALTLLNQVGYRDTTTRTSPYTYTLTPDFDPDDTADALVLMLATEGSSLSATVSFGSQTMTQVIMTGTNPVGIYYLNNPSTSPQPVSVTITASGSISGMGFTIFALNNNDNLGIVPTAVVNEFTSTDPLNIAISVPDSNSFVVAGYNNNSSSGSVGVNSPSSVPPLTSLTGLYGGDFGSLLGAFGYEANVAAGPKTYGFNTSAAVTGHYSAAVAFVGIAAPPTNTAPTISDVTDLSVPSGGNTGPLAFTVTDEDVASVTASGGSSNTTLVPNANIVFGGSGANRTVTVTPVSGLSGGTATITVTLTDNGSLTTQDTFVLTVTDNYLSWSTTNGVTGGTNGDSDNDGVKNLVEYALVNGGERGVLSGNTITFTKRGAPYGSDVTYGIVTSTDLVGWSTPGSGVTENASTISYTFTPGTPVKNFARLKITQN